MYLWNLASGYSQRGIQFYTSLCALRQVRLRAHGGAAPVGDLSLLVHSGQRNALDAKYAPAAVAT